MSNKNNNRKYRTRTALRSAKVSSSISPRLMERQIRQDLNANNLSIEELEVVEVEEVT